MTALPRHIKDLFFSTIKGDTSLISFEQWLYQDTGLEQILDPDDYIELISLDFKQNGAKYELYRLLKKQVSMGEYETYKLHDLLTEATLSNARLPYILAEFYNLYCSGYAFLRELGLRYGLAVRTPIIESYTANTWKELTVNQQQEMLNSFSPKLEKEIEKVISWLNDKRIVLTGEVDELGHYEYKDYRTKAERRTSFDAPDSKNDGSFK